mmetsp:Transcript_5020/g.7878  ORF Transcript_5020/g.7878 Transcript_5020/m.7878 type:complete len:418 (+) Transcript_5020:92-1345(+)|eukprot:CAMPEP_0194211036 /NCGR_PEP_ID=MMETSP0156-20130528/9249_1 /TAXON_ID=33649 /ORGANISM="Thalassionema nitzschioides, Strain L26-B" /LENGTH=417 /DNA_ID=CAMNT_0038938461 /DNA_START=106 /DNA_END=1359 /DNA_ORIENTATION=-
MSSTEIPEIMKTVMGHLHNNTTTTPMMTIAGSSKGESGFFPNNSSASSSAGLDSRLNYPTGVALDDQNGDLYVTDQNNQRLVRLTPGKDDDYNYTLSVLMGNTLQFDEEKSGKPKPSKPKGDKEERSDECDQFNQPAQILVERLHNNTEKNIIYFTDKDNHRICRILLDNTTTIQEFQTLAGSIEGEGGLVNTTNTPLDVRFTNPMGMALDRTTNEGEGTIVTKMYVADIANHAIRIVTFTENESDGLLDSTVQCETLIGGTESGCQDGSFEDAKLHYPLSVVIDKQKRFLYVADFGNNRVVQIDLIQKQVSTLAGSTTGEAGSGDGSSAKFTMPTCVACNCSSEKDDDDAVYVTDWKNHRVCRILRDGTTATILGSRSGESGCSDSLLNNPGAIVVDGTTVYLADTGNNRIVKVTL